MQRLLEAGQYFKLEKWEFYKETVRYLGLVISTKGICMGEDTIETIQNWSREIQVQEWTVTQSLRGATITPIPQLLLTVHFKIFWKSGTINKSHREGRTILMGIRTAAGRGGYNKCLYDCTYTLTFRPWESSNYWEDAFNYVSAGVLSYWDDERVLHSLA
jgi:hypothetical protein